MSAVAGPSTRPVTVFYCGVCSLPTEYCEFGPSFSKCKSWLEEQDPQEFQRLWGTGSLESRIGTLSIEKQEKLEQDAAKAEKKAEKKAEQEQKKKDAAKVHTVQPHQPDQTLWITDIPANVQITIKRSERTKRKHATHVHGLDLFGVDLKKAAKLFAGKFATGSSVSKNPQGEDEIVIQGDVGDDIVEMIRAQVKELKGAPVDQIVRVEVKKKKEPEPTP